MKKWSQIETVVVPIDFSEASFEALEASLELVEGAEVRPIHVLAELSPVEIGVVFGAVDDATRAAHVKAAFARELAARGLAAPGLDVRTGSAGPEICAYALSHAADLIVMPSRGLTSLASLFLGSVAQAVVAHASCPVLVFKEPVDG